MAGTLASMAVSAATHFMIFRTPQPPDLTQRLTGEHGLLASLYRDFKRVRAPARYDFRTVAPGFDGTPTIPDHLLRVPLPDWPTVDPDQSTACHPLSSSWISKLAKALPE